MKRALALLTALCLLASCAVAEDAGATQEVAAEKNGLTVIRMKTSGETDNLIYKVDYPTFECEDSSLSDYLKKTVADPLLALRKLDAMSADTTVYANGKKDSVRMSFFASLDFSGVLSLEASVRNRAADQSRDEMLFYYRLIDLNQHKELTVYDLFTQPRDQVDTAIRTAVFASETAKGTPIVTEAAQVPAPNSYYLSADAFRCLFAAGTVEAKAVAVDIPWADLGLTPSPLLTAQADETADAADASAASDAPVASDAGDTAAADTAPDAATLSALLQANDWKADDRTLRFMPDGSITDPTGDDPMFVAYTFTDNKLYLSSVERPDQGVSAEQTADGLLLTFDPETSDYTTLTLVAADDTAQAETETAAPLTPPPPADVATPTPMPLTGDDAELADFLSQGLWKQIGTDGNTYYQFTPDGKLLTIEVSPYTVSGGTVESEGIAGSVAAGGTAFTVTRSDGTQVGYVLNRSATAIPAAEFVTPTPTPTPSPTPAPTPTPSPSPTPSPTPKPTPTLSPYEQAAQTAPSLAVLDGTGFTKRQTFKVYSAPDEASFRDSKAQVTTDTTVSIFGVTGKWLLVSYKIGNGSRGRIGYIGTGTLANPDSVAQIEFADIAVTLTKAAKATDDPLSGKATLFTLKKDTSVKLLAFLGKEWAYVETTYKDKVCRAFIPRTALITE